MNTWQTEREKLNGGEDTSFVFFVSLNNCCGRFIFMLMNLLQLSLKREQGWCSRLNVVSEKEATAAARTASTATAATATTPSTRRAAASTARSSNNSNNQRQPLIKAVCVSKVPFPFGQILLLCYFFCYCVIETLLKTISSSSKMNTESSSRSFTLVWSLSWLQKWCVMKNSDSLYFLLLVSCEDSPTEDVSMLC